MNCGLRPQGMERHVRSDGIVEVPFVARRACGIGVPADEVPTVCRGCSWFQHFAATQHADGIDGRAVAVHVETDRIEFRADGDLRSVLVPAQYEAVVVKREIGVRRCRVVYAVAARHRNGSIGGRCAMRRDADACSLGQCARNGKTGCVIII